MTCEKVEDGYLIRLFPGEELVSSLTEFAAKENIPSCTLMAIGAVDEVELGYFQSKKKTYKRRTFKEELEVISLLGNFSYIDGKKPFFHIHGVFGTSTFEALVGHVFSARVSVTLEAHLTVFSKKVSRTHDPQFDLNLLKLEGCPHH